LTEKIYQHGSLYEPQDLLKRVTGQTLQADAYLSYLDKKFGAIYGL
jgi:carboxypeptidase Taq